MSFSIGKMSKLAAIIEQHLKSWSGHEIAVHVLNANNSDLAELVAVTQVPGGVVEAHQMIDPYFPEHNFPIESYAEKISEAVAANMEHQLNEMMLGNKTVVSNPPAFTMDTVNKIQAKLKGMSPYQYAAVGIPAYAPEPTKWHSEYLGIPYGGKDDVWEKLKAVNSHHLSEFWKCVGAPLKHNDMADAVACAVVGMSIQSGPVFDWSAGVSATPDAVVKVTVDESNMSDDEAIFAYMEKQEKAKKESAFIGPWHANVKCTPLPNPF